MKKVFMGLALVIVCLFFYQAFLGSHAMEDGVVRENIAAIEESVKRSAIQCYALEGRYPPDIAYLQEHYGLIVNEDAYFYHYEVIASNILPNIAVYRRW